MLLDDGRPFSVVICTLTGTSYTFTVEESSAEDISVFSLLKSLKQLRSCESWIRETASARLMLLNDCIESEHCGDPLPVLDEESSPPFWHYLSQCRTTSDNEEIILELRLAVLSQSEFRIGVLGKEDAL